MAFSIKSDWNANISSLFEENSNRYVINPNAYLLSGSSKISGSGVTLEVKDSEGTQQYLLTQATSPAVVLNSGSNVYYVDSVDVTAFPEGNIDFIWSITSGSDYVLTSSLDLSNPPDVVFVQGQTATLQDFSLVLGQAKTFNIRLQDATGNPFDGNACRVVFSDTLNGSIIERVDASLTGSGQGLWGVQHTPASSSYTAALNRYELFWEAQLQSGGNYFEVENSRHLFQIYGATGNIKSSDLTYCTNQDLRTNIIGINNLLSNQINDLGEMEIILNQQRLGASSLISQFLKANPQARTSRELLRQWEIHLVWEKILVNAPLFSKMASNGLALKEVQKQRYQIESAIVGPIQFLRIQD